LCAHHGGENGNLAIIDFFFVRSLHCAAGTESDNDKTEEGEKEITIRNVERGLSPASSTTTSFTDKFRSFKSSEQNLNADTTTHDGWLKFKVHEQASLQCSDALDPSPPSARNAHYN